MTDYTSWKVADLKSELKNRGIPQTGLRLKQQIIDKLLEEDDKAQPEGNAVASESEPQPQAEPEQEPEAEKAQAPDNAPPAQESQPEPTPEEPQEKPATQEAPVQPTPTHDEEKTEEDAAEPPVAAEKPAEEKPIEDGETTQAAAPEEKVEAQPAEEAPEEAAEATKADEPSMPPLAPSSEANTGLSTPLPIEEALEDKRKRKRRSQSPVPTPEAMANKKARAQEASPRVQMDEDHEDSTQDKEPVASTEEQSAPAKQAPSAPHKDARFRGLFAPTRPAADRISPPPPAGDITMEDVEVEPALHPATAALYIDGLMRPMQPQALRNHLVSLATAPGSEPNPSVVQDFFLDSIKTHCFAGFADIAAASRVRAALHNTTWPNERNRKILRVDFIPEDKIKEWIQTEESSRNRAGPPVRWEVRYESTEDGMRAMLAESDGVNSRAAPPRTRDGFNRTPPLGPRGSVAQAQADRRQSNAPPAPPSRPGQGFKPLDEIFESTTTKPKLYYKRVPRKVADKRLDQFDELLSKGSFPRRGGDEMRRITFEDDDYFVDVGPEYGPRALQRRQGRGGRGGRRRD
jgi:chemotaxis protein histidine kinase CheA